jgi:hypothetical protein
MTDPENSNSLTIHDAVQLVIIADQLKEIAGLSDVPTELPKSSIIDGAGTSTAEKFWKLAGEIEKAGPLSD